MSEPSRRRGLVLIVGLPAIIVFALLTPWMTDRWPTSACQIGLFLLGMTWCVHQFFRPAPILKTWLLLPLGLAASWGPFQLILSSTVYRFPTFTKSLEWLACLVAFFLIVQALNTEEREKYFRRGAAWFGFALALLSYVQYLTSHGKIFWLIPTGLVRVLGPFINRDHYSILIELLLPLALYESRRDQIGLIYSLMAGVMYASVVASTSRAGAILATAMLLVLPVILYRRHVSPGVFAKAALMPLAGAAILAATVDWEPMLLRFSDSAPFQGRNQLNIASFQMLKEHPWIGYGLGTWTDVYPAHAIISQPGFVNAAHNDWAQWAAEGGIFLPILMFTVFCWSAVRAYRFPWAIGIPVFMIHSAVDFPFQIPALSLSFFVLLGTLAAAHPDAAHSH